MMEWGLNLKKPARRHFFGAAEHGGAHNGPGVSVPGPIRGGCAGGTVGRRTGGIINPRPTNSRGDSVSEQRWREGPPPC